MEEANEEETMVVEELAIVGGRRISVTTSRRVSVQRTSVSSSSFLPPSFEHVSPSAALLPSETVAEAGESEESESSDDESVVSGDGGSPPLSPQLQIETSPQDVAVEEELMIDPASMVYEKMDPVLPSAPVS